LQGEPAAAIQRDAWEIVQGTDRLWELVQRMVNDLPGYDEWKQTDMGLLRLALTVMMKPALVVHFDGWREYKRVEEVALR
jgi:hypothetical protein